MRTKITPTTVLPIGTPVQVWSRRGTVHYSYLAPESTGKGMIAVHEIRFTEHLAKTGRVAGANVRSWRAYKKPILEFVNYSAIRI